MSKFTGSYSGPEKKLRVKDAFKEDAGKGRVRIDPSVVNELGLRNGDVIRCRFR